MHLFVGPRHQNLYFLIQEGAIPQFWHDVWPTERQFAAGFLKDAASCFAVWGSFFGHKRNGFLARVLILGVVHGKMGFLNFHFDFQPL